MTDPIADFLTRIRNGITAAHEKVEIPSSKLKVEIARILAEQGYIRSYETCARTTRGARRDARRRSSSTRRPACP